MESHSISGEERRNIFLVVKEALHNTVKHAEASKVTITFNVKEDQLDLTIADNGKGLENIESQFGNGLDNMTKRIELINGNLEYTGKNGLIFLPMQKKTVGRQSNNCKSRINHRQTYY